MKDLDPAKRILGVEIKRDREKRTLFLSQMSYLIKLLDRFDMSDSKPIPTPLTQRFKLTAIQKPISDE